MRSGGAGGSRGTRAGVRLPDLHRAGGAIGPLVLVGGMSVATFSVVQYRLGIVAAYTALAVFLGLALALGRAGRLDRGSTAAALVLTAVSIVTVHAYTYLLPADARALRWWLAATALLAALAFGLPLRRGPDLGLGLALTGYLVAAVTLIRLDPAPKIDVWVTLQQASDALAAGKNIYTQTWVGSPGVQDAFTYLPGTAVLLAPGRLLAGDVRWMLVAVTVAAVIAVRLSAGRGPLGPAVPAAGAGALLLLLPGTSTQVEQAWTEPLLFACLAGWAVATRLGRTVPAVVLLALGLASKQHLVLLLPVLAAWPRFGPRRTAAAAGLAGLAMLPWFLASPPDFWHDTVQLLINFQPLKFADTLFIAALNELGSPPPFWLTGAVVIASVTIVSITVHRRNPGLGEVIRWLALILFVANLVNKQAFYNQYWLVAALVLLSWACPDPVGAGPPEAQRPSDAARDRDEQVPATP